MLIRHRDAPIKEFKDCHDGKGTLRCWEVFAEYKRAEPGVRFIHDDILPPGTAIGVHEHKGDEELYIILEGSGTMIDDGQRHPVGPGDACLTRSGHSHGLENTGSTALRLLVVNSKMG